MSARIFAAMSVIFGDYENFGPLIPLLSSLVNAEIVSLQNREEHHDVYFINKKVCFSGFDYSSTTPAVDKVSGSHVDLCSNIKALEKVLQQAQLLPRPVFYLDMAIGCLQEMSSCSEASVACSKVRNRFFYPFLFKKLFADFEPRATVNIIRLL